jgi:hypothetical protein
MVVMKQSLRYGAAAVVMALAIIGTTLYVNTGVAPVNGQTNFLVMLTDPPNVPWGTTQLNVTYSGIQLHVVYSDGTSNWVAAQESGRVNLISLVNVSQTIASLDLPTGSTMDKLQFTISSAEAKIGGEVYPVTVLSDQLVVTLRATKLNGTQTGALIDLRPTLMEIHATNSTGGHVSYYVLVPSATAIVKSNVQESQTRIGARFRIEERDHRKLWDEYVRASRDVTITSSTLTVNGNETTLTVTLKNNGDASVAVTGLTLQGEFDVSYPASSSDQHDGKGLPGFSGFNHGGMSTMFRPSVIPFKVSGTSLVPLFGDFSPFSKNGYSRLELEPGQSATLTFQGVVRLYPDLRGRAPHVAVTPIVGGSYTLRVEGMGSQSYQVTAS